MPSSRVTATSLSLYAHLQCDLYLHQSYHHGSLRHNPEPRESPAAISLAAFTSGNAWESALLTHLDQLGLLLTNSGPPLSGLEIASVIELDDRPHFFVAGIVFWPPAERLAEEYAKYGVKAENVPRFGLAKPDLLEIWRNENGVYVWRVIDAKASKDVKTSHLVQTYFYYLCLSFILPPSFAPAPTTAIWLPPDSSSSVTSSVPFPSLATLHPTPIVSLVSPLTDLIYIKLPAILSTVHSEVPWHFNPLCRTCPFSSTCRARVEKENGLGRAGEVTLNEAHEIRGFMKLARGVLSTSRGQDADIEDLVHNLNSLSVTGVGEYQDSELAQLRGLLQNEQSMDFMEKKWPATVKKVRRILGLQQRNKSRASSSSKHQETVKLRSPVIEAALMNLPKFTNRQIYTLPSSEDIAIYISFIIDPSQAASMSSISEFCVSTEINPSFAAIAQNYGYKPQRHIHGNINNLIPLFSQCIRNVLDLHARILYGNSKLLNDRATRNRDSVDLPRTQFYVWSAQERDALQRYLVNAASAPSNSQSPSVDDPEMLHSEDIRICIGALCEGASLLATAFQPHVLNGALLGFLGKRGQTMGEMKDILDRLGIKLTGNETVEAMHKKIIGEIGRLRHQGEHCKTKRRTVGLLPRIVVLKKELRRLVALPVPGWWDAKEAGHVFGVPNASQCPPEEELFRRFWEGEAANLVSGMELRNNTCQELVSEIRHMIDCLSERSNILVNRARVMSVDLVDICRVGVLRKLFYMQQFEVLLKLQELWDARMEGCPDAPLLVYRSTSTDPQDGNGAVQLHHFDLVAGSVDVATERDRDRAFFDYILVQEDEEDQSDKANTDNHLPLEALFDDLCVSSLVFPLNRYTYNKWEDGQVTEVKEGNLWVAHIRDVNITGGVSQVVMRTWSGSGTKKALLPGRTYRLSPRLVDFNTTKLLSTLLELDLKTTSTTTTSSSTNLPLFVELISRPKSFGGHRSAVSFMVESGVKEVVLDAEASLHRLYTKLRDLGNENAGALVLKGSQRQAARRILSERLTVIWGPPGSGKSYTIALSLLRMVEVQSHTRTLAPEHQQIIFVTALTHAAIDACFSKLKNIIKYYRCVPDLSLAWLDKLRLENVLHGDAHPTPMVIGAYKSPAGGTLMAKTWIYTGTVYQLYKFGKRLKHGVDCIVIDEAGQLGLSAASLVLRALSQPSGVWGGKVVVAGDKEQLAPIFSGKYPELVKGQPPLFGSILDCLMRSDEGEDSLHSSGVTTAEYENLETVVPLLENFRLNPDLGDFVQTIYKWRFKSQKSQTKLLATRLRRLENETSHDVMTEKGRAFLLSLSNAILGHKQSLLEPPTKQETSQQTIGTPAPGDYGIYIHPDSTSRPISLSMVRLHVKGDLWGEMGYESHVRAEAKVAAVLVRLLEKACDEEDGIFVACPHRLQRAAVNKALSEWDARGKEQRNQDEDEDEELQQMMLKMGINVESMDGNQRKEAVEGSCVPVTVDTIERLQGSEASFVICLFSYTHQGSLATALPFLLERRRLNVAISRTKTLCIVISSEGVLRPGVSVFSDRESARGYAFLREFEDRAWNTAFEVEIEV